MAVEIKDLDFIHFSDNPDDEDLLVIYDVSEPSGNTKKVKRGGLLYNVVFEEGNHTLGEIEISDLTTSNSSIGFTGGSSLDYAAHGAGSLIVGDIAAGASQTITATLTGALPTHQLIWNITEALPDGLVCQAWVSANDTVTFKFYNSTAATVTGATYGALMTVLGFS